MERFYLSSFTTCLKSGTLLFVAGVMIVFALRLAEWTVIGGIMTIAIGAVVYGRSLARAGFDAMLVQLSGYSRAKSFLMISGAVCLNGVAYLVLFALGFVVGNLEIDLARILSLIAALAYLPATVFLITDVAN